MREEEERKGPRAPVIPTWVAAANGPGGAWAIRLGAAVGSSFATPAGVAALVIYGAVAATTLGLVFGARLRLAAGLTPGLSFAWPAKPGARTAWGKGAAGAAGAATDDPAVSGSLDAFRAANREALAEGSSATESAAAAAAQDPGAEGSAVSAAGAAAASAGPLADSVAAALMTARRRLVKVASLDNARGSGGGSGAGAALGPFGAGGGLGRSAAGLPSGRAKLGVRATAARTAASLRSGKARVLGGAAGAFRQLALAARTSREGALALNPQRSGYAFDNAAAAPAPGGSPAALDGMRGVPGSAGRGEGGPIFAENPPRQATPPPVGSEKDVTPYQGLVDRAKMLLMLGLTMLALTEVFKRLARKTVPPNPTYLALAKAFSVAALIAGMGAAVMGALIRNNHDQRSQGLIFLLGGGIIAAKAAHALATMKNVRKVAGKETGELDVNTRLEQQKLLRPVVRSRRINNP